MKGTFLETCAVCVYNMMCVYVCCGVCLLKSHIIGACICVAILHKRPKKHKSNYNTVIDVRACVCVCMYVCVCVCVCVYVCV